MVLWLQTATFFGNQKILKEYKKWELKLQDSY